jgi:hypothetical protein
MQILASALPGFRDLRAPLTAGYMWLLFVYLLVRPEIGARPANEIGAAVFDLANEVGRVWVAVGVGTAAYLVGAISDGVGAFLYSRLFAKPATVYGEIRSDGSKPKGNFLVGYLRVVFFRSIPVEGRPGFSRNAAGRGDLPNYMQRAPRAVVEQFGRITTSSVDPDSDEVASNFLPAIRDIEREPDLPATILVEGNPTLFAEVDRLRAEGDLRFAVTLPLVGLSLLLTFVSSAWWLLSLVGAVALVVQGHSRRRQSRQLILDAIQQGRIESPALRRLTDWVDQFLTGKLPAAT